MSEPVDRETIELMTSTRSYLDALLDAGLLEGDEGDQRVTHSAVDGLRALHHVLAGGSVMFLIQSEGTPSVMDDLDRALQAALDDVRRCPGDIRLCF